MFIDLIEKIIKYFDKRLTDDDILIKSIAQFTKDNGPVVNYDVIEGLISYLQDKSEITELFHAFYEPYAILLIKENKVDFT